MFAAPGWSVPPKLAIKFEPKKKGDTLWLVASRALAEKEEEKEREGPLKGLATAINYDYSTDIYFVVDRFWLGIAIFIHKTKKQKKIWKTGAGLLAADAGVGFTQQYYCLAHGKAPALTWKARLPN